MNNIWLGMAIVLAGLLAGGPPRITRLSDTTFVKSGIGIDVCNVTTGECVALRPKLNMKK